MESLKGYRFPDSEERRFEALKNAVDNFDYDLIPEILTGAERILNGRARSRCR